MSNSYSDDRVLILIEALKSIQGKDYNYNPQVVAEEALANWDKDRGRCNPSPALSPASKGFLAENILEMKQSLDNSVESAGGLEFSVERLKEMSAFDLMVTLCVNGVRFHYRKEK